MPLFKTARQYADLLRTPTPAKHPGGNAPSARRAVPHRKLCTKHRRQLVVSLRSVFTTMADVQALFYPPPAGFPSVDYSGCRSKQDFAEARWNAWKDFVPPGGSSKVVIYRPRHLR